LAVYFQYRRCTEIKSGVEVLTFCVGVSKTHLIHAGKLQSVFASAITDSDASFSTPVGIIDNFVIGSIVSTPLAGGNIIPFPLLTTNLQDNIKYFNIDLTQSALKSTQFPSRDCCGKLFDSYQNGQRSN
jgi:hypothetical protein